MDIIQPMLSALPKNVQAAVEQPIQDGIEGYRYNGVNGAARPQAPQGIPVQPIATSQPEQTSLS